MTTMATAVAHSEPSNDPQIRVQFTTNLPDLQLPENAGPILVPTSKFRILAFDQRLTPHRTSRLPSLWSLNAGQPPPRDDKSDTIRFSHLRLLLTHLHHRIPRAERALG